MREVWTVIKRKYQNIEQPTPHTITLWVLTWGPGVYIFWEECQLRLCLTHFVQDNEEVIKKTESILSLSLFQSSCSSFPNRKTSRDMAVFVSNKLTSKHWTLYWLTGEYEMLRTKFYRWDTARHSVMAWLLRIFITLKIFQYNTQNILFNLRVS